MSPVYLNYFDYPTHSFGENSSTKKDTDILLSDGWKTLRYEDTSI
jgi:hypothetical protein